MLSEINPAASELLIQLGDSETAAQIVEALEAYDASASED